MKQAYNFHSDPSHGWLAVPLKDVHNLGLSLSDFSTYSFQSRSGKTLYLEEDCDAVVFYNRFIERRGVKPAFVEKLYDKFHWIRSMPRIRENG